MIKFRYVLKNITTGDIVFRYYTQKEIERCALMLLMPTTAPYEIIARDRYIEMNDKNKREIYENDIDQYGYTVSYIGGDSASTGLDLGWYLQRNNFESYSIIEYRSYHNSALEIKGTIYDKMMHKKIEDSRFEDPEDDNTAVKPVLQQFDVVNQNKRIYPSNLVPTPEDIKNTVQHPDEIMDCDNCGQCIYIKNIDTKGNLVVVADTISKNPITITCFGLTKNIE